MNAIEKPSSTNVESDQERFKLLDLFFAPVSCLTNASPIFLLIVVAVFSIIAVTGYYTLNSNYFGLIGPHISDYSVMGSYDGFMTTSGESWQITYEFNRDTIFEGIVRKVYPIREGLFPLLTQDVLVTSGDYADPDLVTVRVFNHQFTWMTSKQPPLPGSINLLHTVPLNDEIYAKLLKINKGDEVRISGREILRMNAIKDGKVLGWWVDDGCNTLLVTAVDFIKD